MTADVAFTSISPAPPTALYGGFAHEPFTGESHEYVFVARRPGADA